MKKFFLLASAAAFAMATSAQEPSVEYNKVLNGNFEATGFEQSVPGGYTWAPWNEQKYLSVLPDWNLNTGGEWNGGIELLTGEDYLGDGDLRPEDDQAYLHFVGYNDNGWTNINANQVVTNLVPGTEYTFQYLVAANFPEGASWTPNPSYGYSISEVDYNAEGAAIAGKEIKSLDLATLGDAFPIEQDMKLYTTTFTATADKIFLNLYLSNTYGQGNKHDDLWMDVDLVSVWSESDPNGNVAIENVAVDNNEVLGVYNIQGMRVANNLEQLGADKGLFIVKTANGAKKVVR